ncbi:AAA family ATPase [Parachlamydia sp. AcF125]|uniref:AAA family ATPase n=1 Tax=Parachlamydia sp. AcF125 TaxID=2795736 RepID=UPI001BD8BBAF|nr:AAA family ATPase [Parachlamydia sp. AcF125]MBS4168136.1 hypothetical protein [Parachlamydia sp. AcF125]
MKRDIERHFIAWKTSPIRAPLLLWGARQVGKSWIVEKFSREQFENLVVVNFEQRPEAIACFGTLLPEKIVADLELFTNSIIRTGKTLLFLVEIQ